MLQNSFGNVHRSILVVNLFWPYPLCLMRFQLMLLCSTASLSLRGPSGEDPADPVSASSDGEDNIDEDNLSFCHLAHDVQEALLEQRLEDAPSTPEVVEAS